MGQSLLPYVDHGPNDSKASLISKYLDRMQYRIDREKLDDYREYVRETVRVN